MLLRKDRRAPMKSYAETTYSSFFCASLDEMLRNAVDHHRNTPASKTDQPCVMIDYLLYLYK
jgi:hypothetical protein